MFDQAQAKLEEMITNNQIDARAIIGFYPCNSNTDDDIIVQHEGKEVKFCTLRQQFDKDQESFVAMSDFIAPASSGKQDYIGFFACSAGHGQEEICNKLKEDDDDFGIMLVKSLTDRLAEAFAEHLHVETRKTHWGYSADEDLSIADVINVKYQGIRPAPGYPS